MSMKYYKEIAEKEVFNTDFVASLTHKKSLALAIISNYRKKGYVRKVKHNLYATVSLENDGLIASKFKIACSINETAFVSHHSAFEYYGYYNQVYHTVHVSSLNRFIPFEFDGFEYQYVRSVTDEQVDFLRGVKVTSIERTIVDSIDDIDNLTGIEELLKCIGMVPEVDETLVLDYLNRRSSKLLYKKTGYLLSHFQAVLRLSDRFFETCHAEGRNVIGYFCQTDKSNLVYNHKWGLYAYADIMSQVGGKDPFNV